MTRRFDAPRALVFDAWTWPELLKRWLACAAAGRCPSARSTCGSAAPIAVWRHESGAEMGMGGVYREIVAGKRIVATEAVRTARGIPAKR
ncbi:MAG: SRPBCC domain-containing protein [Planctomycetota bacterium]